MKKLLLASPLLLTACAHSPVIVDKQCDAPARALATVIKRDSDVLHVDFDGFGVDFDSVQLQLDAHAEPLVVYLNPDTQLEGKIIVPGDKISLRVSAPDCQGEALTFLESSEPARAR